MDPNTARGALRLDPAEPLTLQSVDAAYQRELWERHPSRYPDAEGRAAAEAWVVTLGRAHAALVAEVQRPVPASAASSGTATARRGLSRTAVVGIVAGGVVAVALFVAAGVGVYSLVRDATGVAIEQAEAYAEESVEHYYSGETLYTFPAALEIYSDGRYWAECPAEHEQGCWEMALITETDCAELEVTLGFSTDETTWEPDATELVRIDEVTGYAATPVVFGNDDYPYGWITEVVCLDEPAA